MAGDSASKPRAAAAPSDVVVRGAQAVADVASAVAAEAAAVVALLQRGQARPNPAAARAASIADEAARELETLAQGPCCPMDAYRRAALALQAAAVALVEVKHELEDREAAPARAAPGA